MSLFESLDASTSMPDPGSIPPSVRRAAMLEHPTLAVGAMQKGRIRETNPAWKALFALPPGVSIESHVATLFPNAGSVDRFERNLQSELDSAAEGVDKQTARIEHMLVRRDGSAFLAEIVVRVFGDGEVGRALDGDAIWQIRDITIERTLRRELRDLEDYHRELSRHQWDLTFVIDRKGRISYASSSIETALGYRVHTMLGEPFASLLDPEHAAAAEQWLRAASRTPEGEATGDGFPLHVLHSDGHVRVLACRPRDCFAVPRIAGMVVHARDVTETFHVEDVAAAPPTDTTLRGTLMQLAASVRESAEERVAFLLDGARDAVEAMAVTLWTGAGEGPAKTRLSSSSESVARPLSDRAGTPSPWLPLVIDDVRKSESIAIGEERLRDVGAVVEVPVVVDGLLTGWLVATTKSPRKWSNPDVDFLVGVGLLLASFIGPGAEPAELAPVGDPLTGLPGRVAAEGELISRAAQLASGQVLAVLLVDLDGLQDVNDAHGLAIGDRVIAQTAARLTQVAGSHAFLARVDGDQFVVAVEGLSAREIDALVAAVIAGIGDASDDGSGLPHIDVGVGVACYPGDTADPAALIPNAHLAMREAKSRGRGQSFIFHRRLDATLRQRNEIDAEIEQGLEHDEFTLFYQPQLALGTGAVIGLEALLRWQHPTRGLLLPGAFIGTVFRRGLIEAITKAVLTQVCEQIAAWRRTGELPELPVTVNVSGRQFNDRRLPALVASALLKSALPARLLIVEVTEQSLAEEGASVERVVKELSRMGIRVAISDFNMGHASFRYQQQLSVSQIKLDAGFVKTLPEDAESAIVVAGLIDIAHRLDYEVIAEGVETRAQFEFLRSIGCEAGQGFYFAAPMSAVEIRAYLETNKSRPVQS